MRVVVTGAAGLLGSHAVTACRRAGLEVVPITRSAPPGSSVSVRPLDLRTMDAPTALLSLAPDVIVHAAAVLPARFTGTEAEEAAAQNRKIDDAVFEAAAKLRCSIVYLSSKSLYGCTDRVCTEASPLYPRGPYLAEKHRSEEKVLALASRSVVLRVSSPFGVKQRLVTVMQKFIRQAVHGENLLFYGTGAREQDFIAAEDVAEAVLTAVRAPATGVFNVASGRAVSMRDLAELVVTTLRSTSRVRPAGLVDPEEECRARISIERAQRALSWHPTVDLESGIRSLAASMSSVGSGGGESIADGG